MIYALLCPPWTLPPLFYLTLPPTPPPLLLPPLTSSLASSLVFIAVFLLSFAASKACPNAVSLYFPLLLHGAVIFSSSVSVYVSLFTSYVYIKQLQRRKKVS